MSEEKDYVVPPKQKETDYVAPPNRSKQPNDYVAPPKKQTTDYVAPPKGNAGFSQSIQPNQTNMSNDPYTKPKYFQTPKVGLKFYLTGYFVFSVFLFIPDAWGNFTNPYSLESKFGSFMHLVFLVGYILLSTYTYSWFSDYQRAKNGAFSWFFTPYGSIRAGYATSSFMNFQTGTVTKGFWGNYNVRTHTSYGKHIFYFFVIILLTEALKFIIALPLAFLSIFLHKRTIRNYNYLVDSGQAN